MFQIHKISHKRIFWKNQRIIYIMIIFQILKKCRLWNNYLAATCNYSNFLNLDTHIKMMNITTLLWLNNSCHKVKDNRNGLVILHKCMWKDQWCKFLVFLLSTKNLKWCTLPNSYLEWKIYKIRDKLWITSDNWVVIIRIKDKKAQ